MTYDVVIERNCNLSKTMTVLVTGAASGIGFAQVEAFLKNGHNVVAWDKNRIPIEKLQAYPGNLLTEQIDVTDEVAVIKGMKHLIEEFSKLDVLCNTAGALDDYKTLEETDYKTWKKYLNNNIDSVFLVTKAALPYLIEQDASRVINMCSIASLTAGGGGISYTASKHALAGFTKQLAYDYSKHGLRANGIAPGAVKTPMNDADFQDGAKLAKWVADQTPVSRWAQADEIAELTIFLASDKADYIQGQIIAVDGGWLIR